jgi:hypothetical protein
MSLDICQFITNQSLSNSTTWYGKNTILRLNRNSNFKNKERQVIKCCNTDLEKNNYYLQTKKIRAAKNDSPYKYLNFYRTSKTKDLVQN